MLKVEGNGDKAMTKFSDKVRYNWGQFDGLNSRNMENPIHRNWTGPHFDKAYERGYWDAYNQPHCGDCGNPLELVRPGKHQCNHCE